MVGLDHHALFGAMYWNIGLSRKQLDHQAFVVRRQMLDNHKGHAAVQRHGFEKGLNRFQPAR